MCFCAAPSVYVRTVHIIHAEYKSVKFTAELQAPPALKKPAFLYQPYRKKNTQLTVQEPTFSQG